MINWIYNSSIDTHEAIIPNQATDQPDIRLTLSHTPALDFWLLSIDIGTMHMTTTVDTGLNANDINSIKSYVEDHAIANLQANIDTMNQLTAELMADMNTPMPSRRDMAKKLYAEYIQLPDQTGNPRSIGVKWHGFSAGCSRHYIENWFQKNFGIGIDALKAGETL